MKMGLLFIAGVALGCLFATGLRIPWLAPLDSNAASVLTALCSTVLAVLGAFGLWAYQVRKNRMALEAALAPVIDPFYASLCQLRDISEPESAAKLLAVTAVAFNRVQDEVASPSAVLDYQEKAFATQAQTLLTDARILMTPLASVQDLAVSLSPKRLPDLLAVQRIASGVEVHVPRMLEEWAHRACTSDVQPMLSPQSLALVKWAAGALAHILNSLDGGARPEEHFHQLEPDRAAAMKLWGVAQLRLTRSLSFLSSFHLLY